MSGILIGKKPGWEAIPHCVFRSRLPHSTVHLLCNLLTHAEGFKPSYALISKQTGMSSATISKGLKDLVKLGLVKVAKAKNGGTWQKNEYEFVAENIWQLTPELVDYALRGKQPEPDDTALETKDGTALETKDAPLLNLKTKETNINKPVEENQLTRPAGECESDPLNDEFEEWWRHVPRKTSKKKSRSLYGKARKSGVSARVLIDAMERDKLTWKREGRDVSKIPYPSTWLGQERWADEPDDWSPVFDQAPRPQNFMDALRASRQTEWQAGAASLPESARGELSW